MGSSASSSSLPAGAGANWAAGAANCSTQVWVPMGSITRSPSVNVSTPSPNWMTVPTPSKPGVAGSGMRKLGRPRMQYRSAR